MLQCNADFKGTVFEFFKTNGRQEKPSIALSYKQACASSGLCSRICWTGKRRGLRPPENVKRIICANF